MNRAVLAVAAAAVFSGAPSTVHALATGASPLAAVRAAATLLPGRSGLVAGVLAHGGVSAFWGAAFVAVHRRRRLGVLGGAAGGLLVAALDLELIGRAYPAIRALPRVPQWLDHALFGAIVGGLA